MTIHTLDLNFLGLPGVIAAYLIPHAHGAILIESGPGSTQAGLTAGLAAHGYKPGDVTHLLLTHIHLDHAGAAGWLARQGAQVYVHDAGAPHLLDPAKLIASATRIYGERMETLWGEFLAVPQDKLTILHDLDTVEVGQLHIQAYDTPGHANHHLAYLFQEALFSGDIGGVRLSGQEYISVPMPPPEFHLEKWRASLARLAALPARWLAPTHFGLHPDPERHFAGLAHSLDQIEGWILKTMPANPEINELRQSYQAWVQEQTLAEGFNQSVIQAYEAANPTFMSADGIHRYWRKVRNVGEAQ